MQRYGNLSGDSGVTEYDIGTDFIRVRFHGATVYVYDYTVPGPHHVERMKTLARKGRGLGTYISQHVRRNYARKE